MIGIIGYLVAAVMGIWLLVAIIKKGRLQIRRQKTAYSESKAGWLLPAEKKNIVVSVSQKQE
jgi:O-antigen/teichoic acid export membrane protein